MPGGQATFATARLLGRLSASGLGCGNYFPCHCCLARRPLHFFSDWAVKMEGEVSRSQADERSDIRGDTIPPPQLPFKSFEHGHTRYKRTSQTYQPPLTSSVPDADTSSTRTGVQQNAQKTASPSERHIAMLSNPIGSSKSLAVHQDATSQIQAWTWESVKMTEQDLDPDIRRRIAATQRHNRAQKTDHAVSGSGDVNSLLFPVRQRWGVGPERAQGSNACKSSARTAN